MKKEANYTSQIIHDLTDDAGLPSLKEGVLVINSNRILKNCIGCFGCWTKTPGSCIIDDGFQGIGRESNALILISRCVYGGLSPQVKKAMDRSISYLLPFFTIRGDQQMHHVCRYDKQIELTIFFYGTDITENEMETARKLVERNAINLNARAYSVRFFASEQDVKEALA